MKADLYKWLGYGSGGKRSFYRFSQEYVTFCYINDNFAQHLRKHVVVEALIK